MDLTRPPRELEVAPGRWRTMDGRAPDEPLVIRPTGPLLTAARPDWLVVTGWRDMPDQPMPLWTVAQVERAAVADADWQT